MFTQTQPLRTPCVFKLRLIALLTDLGIGLIFTIQEKYETNIDALARNDVPQGVTFFPQKPTSSSKIGLKKWTGSLKLNPSVRHVFSSCVKMLY